MARGDRVENAPGSRGLRRLTTFPRSTIMSLLLKLRHSLSVFAACLLLAGSVAIAATPTPAQAAHCYRNCNNCTQGPCPYEWEVFCCAWCEGQDPECGCSFFCPT